MSANQNNILIDSDTRIIMLSDDIDENSVSKVSFSILTINALDDIKEKELKSYERTPIKMYINSGGGHIYDMWHLINIMLNSKTPIYTYCTGKAFSAAGLIFLAGSKRYIGKYGKIMIHQMTLGQYGKYKDLTENWEEVRNLNQTIYNYILEKTSISNSKLTQIWNKKQDAYFDVEEAIKFELADEVLE